MKKTVIAIAAASLVLSMLASSAMADTIKTTSDFKDLNSLDAGQKSKIDTLLSQGIVEGVSDDSFGINQNMTRAQFAKVASLVFRLPVDMTVRASGFTDVRSDDPANGWAIPYIEAAKRAGLIDGMTDSTFAPGDNVTVGQLDTVFVKGLGKAVHTNASPWYAEAVRQAVELGIHPANKGGEAPATRGDLAASAYSSWQASRNLNDSYPVSVSSVQASGDHSVQVTLDHTVDTSKAVLSLGKEGKTVLTSTAWSSGGQSAVLTLTDGTKLSNGTYTVTLSGLDPSAIRTASGTFTIGSSATTDRVNYSITDSYDLANVIDSKLTQYATGTNGYAMKAEAEDPATSKFAKEIALKATTASGDEIALPGSVLSITSTNPTIVKTAVSADRKGYILGNKAGSTTLNIVYVTAGGESRQMSIPVNVKSDPVAAVSIEAGNYSLRQDVSVVGSVYVGLFNAYENMDLKVTDNYGIEYERDEVGKYNFALGLNLLAEDIQSDPDQGPEGTVTIDSDGSVFISGNVTRFTLTANLPNGQRAYSEVKVRQD